jgi:hypothetical protein
MAVLWPGRVPAREHLGAAGHDQGRFDHHAPLLRLQPGGLDDRVRPHTDAPHERPGAHDVPALELRAVGGGLLDGVAHTDLDTAGTQHLVRGPRQARVQLGQHLGRDVEQQPADLLVAQLRVPFGDGLGEQRPLRGDLGPGVAGADDHERAAGVALGLVVGDGGEFDLADDVVPQVERLGHAAEAVRVLGDAGDRQELVDAARGEDEPVVGELVVALLGVGVGDGTAVDVDLVHGAERQPDPRQRGRQRHGHPPGVDDRRRDLGQQRQVEEVVGRVDQDDLDVVLG